MARIVFFTAYLQMDHSVEKCIHVSGKFLLCTRDHDVMKLNGNQFFDLFYQYSHGMYLNDKKVTQSNCLLKCIS